MFHYGLLRLTIRRQCKVNIESFKLYLSWNIDSKIQPAVMYVYLMDALLVSRLVGWLVAQTYLLTNERYYSLHGCLWLYLFLACVLLLLLSRGISEQLTRILFSLCLFLSALIKRLAMFSSSSFLVLILIKMSYCVHKCLC